MGFIGECKTYLDAINTGHCGRDEMTMLAQQFATAYQDLSIPEVAAKI